jgi:hypothetical protein
VQVDLLGVDDREPVARQDSFGAWRQVLACAWQATSKRPRASARHGGFDRDTTARS